MGLSLTRRGPVDRAALVVPDPAGRVDRAVPDPAGPADLDPADLVDLAVRDPAGLGLAGPVDLAHIRDPVGRADLDLEDRVDLAVPVGLGPVDQGMGRAGLVGLDLADLVGRVDLDPADLVGRVDLGMDLVDLVGRVAQAMNPVDPADPVDRAGREDLGDRVYRVDRAGLAIRADRKRRTRPEVLSTGVGPRWADPGMCRTASAPPTTVHRLRPDNTDGAGMAGPRPERSRLGGTDHRPRVAGAVRRLPVVGTVHGMVRRVTGASRNAISGRSITTGTTRSQCSIRSSGDGASGSSDSGFRCTETT